MLTKYKILILREGVRDYVINMYSLVEYAPTLIKRCTTWTRSLATSFTDQWSTTSTKRCFFNSSLILESRGFRNMTFYDDPKSFKTFTGVFKENFLQLMKPWILGHIPVPAHSLEILQSSIGVITTHVIFTRRLSRLSPVLRTALQSGWRPLWKGQRNIFKSNLSNFYCY